MDYLHNIKDKDEIFDSIHKNINIVPILSNVLKDYQTTYEDMKFELYIDDDRVLTTIGNTALQTILRIVIDNGIESYQDKDSFKDKNNIILSLDSKFSKDEVIIKIQDHGLGMTNEKIIQYGKQQISSKHNGSGVGTFTAMNLVDLVNGSLEVENSSNSGTIIKLELKKA